MGHDLAWLLMHPAWGLGFFILVNRAVQSEHAWAKQLRRPRIVPRLVSVAATIGVFSYSLYLTHELVIMQSWWFVLQGLPPILNTMLIVVPATVAFAWLFFQFCEKPFMRKIDRKVTEDAGATEPVQVFAGNTPPLPDEA
jgi:peptidoglycan/LPS O-acetylase OafA/YrhL